MGFAYGWSRMPLGVISRVSFGFGVILERNRKSAKKLENLGIIGLLRRSVRNPRRSIGNPRRSVDLR